MNKLKTHQPAGKGIIKKPQQGVILGMKKRIPVLAGFFSRSKKKS